ncbi:MAG: c-type cytochrome [Planctomycetota bacterium]|jgi:cbb3-type cytochrome oxidase cytochrome c subunit
MSTRPSARFNDPGYFYNQKKLLILFTAASALMMAGILAMIWVDFERPWKSEQRAQMKWEASKLAVEERILSDRTQALRSELAKERKSAKKLIAKREGELEKVRAELQSARGANYLADMDYKAQKQFTSQAEWHVHEAQSEAEREEWSTRLRLERDKEHRLRDNAQLAAANMDRLIKRENEIRADLDAVFEKERQSPELKRLKLIAMAVEKKKSYSPLREIPLLDFLAPPTKVEQIVLEHLVDNYEFSTPKKVDRCGTCHIGAMRLGFDPETWPVDSFPRKDKEDVARVEEGLYRFLFDLLDSVTPKVPRNEQYAHELGLRRKVEIHHQVLDLLFAEYDPDSGEIGLDRYGKKIPKRWRYDEKKKRWVATTKKSGQSIEDLYIELLEGMQTQWQTHPHLGDMVGAASAHPYEQFGCSVCHQGRGWSVDFGFAYHTPDREQVEDWMTTERAYAEDHHLPLSADHTLEEAMAAGKGPFKVHTGWVEDSKTGERWEHDRGWAERKRHYWHWPQLPKMLVESACLKCHKEGLFASPEKEYEHVRLGRPDPSAPSLLPWELNAKAFNDEPALQEAGDYDARLFIPREPETYRPESLQRGLDSFLRFGCYGCHKLDPKAYPFMQNERPRPAPQLNDIAAKTSGEFLLKWVRNPKDFRPDTRMPRFWGLSNNSHDFSFRFAEGGDDTVKGQAWSDAETYSIVAWIQDESAKRARSFGSIDLRKGDPERGARIVIGDYDASKGDGKACIACHEVPVPEALAYDSEAMAEWVDRATRKTFGWKERMTRRQGPNLNGIGSKVNPAWLYGWIKSPRSYWHDTSMPDLRLTDQEALDVTSYLMTLKHPAFDNLPTVSYEPAVLEKLAQELKVSEQMESTETAVSIVKRWSERERVLYAGSKLVKHYGCFGCHEIEAYKETTPIGTELTEWGSKLIERLEFNHAPIQHERFDFAYLKLINPRIYDLGMPRRNRPYERLRMPRFGFTPEESKDLSTFLVGLVNDPIPKESRFRPEGRQAEILRGRQVVRRYNCQGCHIIEGKGGDVWPTVKKVKWRPPDLLGQGRKTNPSWLFHFMNDPAFVAIPGVAGTDRLPPWHSIRMPTFHLTDEESRALVRYFAALSEVPADFETTEPDGLTGPGTQFARAKDLKVKDPKDKTRDMNVTAQNRLEEARAMFLQYQCKSCHSSDPNIPIENRAPDFRHTREGRLREAWIETWLWGPYKLQPGTAMPSFFEREVDGRRVPAAQDKQFFAERPKVQADEQIRALRDFVRHHYTEED